MKIQYVVVGITRTLYSSTSCTRIPPWKKFMLRMVCNGPLQVPHLSFTRSRGASGVAVLASNVLSVYLKFCSFFSSPICSHAVQCRAIVLLTTNPTASMMFLNTAGSTLCFTTSPYTLVYCSSCEKNVLVSLLGSDLKRTYHESTIQVRNKITSCMYIHEVGVDVFARGCCGHSV